MRFDSRLEIRMAGQDRERLETLAAERQWPLGVLVRELIKEGVAREVEAKSAVVSGSRSD